MRGIVSRWCVFSRRIATLFVRCIIIVSFPVVTFTIHFLLVSIPTSHRRRRRRRMGRLRYGMHRRPGRRARVHSRRSWAIFPSIRLIRVKIHNSCDIYWPLPDNNLRTAIWITIRIIWHHRAMMWMVIGWVVGVRRWCNVRLADQSSIWSRFVDNFRSWSSSRS